MAIADADVMTLHWFADQAYLGVSFRNVMLWYNAKPGHYIIRVVDDRDRVDSLAVTVL